MASLETEIRNRKLALTLIIVGVVLDLVFDIIRGNGPRVEWFAWTGHDFTPPSKDWDGKLFLSTILYHGCAHLSLICFFVAAYLSPVRIIFKIMAWFEVLDFVDYGITYNQTWFELDQIIPGLLIPFEFAFFKSMAIILFALKCFYGATAKLR